MTIFENKKLFPYCVGVSLASALLSGCTVTRSSSGEDKNLDTLHTTLESSQTLEIFSKISTLENATRISNKSANDLFSAVKTIHIGGTLPREEYHRIKHLCQDVDAELKGTGVLEAMRGYLKNDPEEVDNLLRVLLNRKLPEDLGLVSARNLSDILSEFTSSYAAARKVIQRVIEENVTNPDASTVAKLLLKEFKTGKTPACFSDDVYFIFFDQPPSKDYMSSSLETLDKAFRRFKKAVSYETLSEEKRRKADKIVRLGLDSYDYLAGINQFIPCLRKKQELGTPLSPRIASGLIECFSIASQARRDAYLSSILSAGVYNKNSTYFFFVQSSEAEKLLALKFFAEEDPELFTIAQNLIGFSMECPIFPASNTVNNAISIKGSMEAHGEPISYDQNSFAVGFPRAFKKLTNCLTWPTHNFTVITSDSGEPNNEARLLDILAREIRNVSKGTNWNYVGAGEDLELSTLLKKGIKRSGIEFSEVQIPAINEGEGLTPLSFEDPTTIIYIAGRKFDGDQNPTEETWIDNLTKLKAELEIGRLTTNFLLVVPSEDSFIQLMKLLEKDPDKKSKNLIFCLAGQTKEVVQTENQYGDAKAIPYSAHWGSFQSGARSSFSEPMLKAALSGLSRQFKHVALIIDAPGSGVFLH